MATWTVEHFAAGGLSFGGTSRSVGVGGTPAEGELVVLVVNTHSDNVAQLPAGFTQVFNGQHPNGDGMYGAIFAKVAAASGEASSYTVTYSAAAGQHTAFGCILACDEGVGDLEASITAIHQTSWPAIPIPSMTTTVDEALHIAVAMGNDGITGASPSGWTVVGGDGQTRIRAAVKEQATAGTSAGASSIATCNNSGFCVSFGFQPGGGGAPEPIVLEPAAHHIAVTWGTSTVEVTAHQTLTPAAHAIAVTWGTATVAVSAHQTLAPAVHDIAVTWGTSSVAVTEHVTVEPAPHAVAISWGTPTVAVTGHVWLRPAAHVVSVAWGTPSLVASGHVVLTPSPLSVAVTWGTSTVAVTGDVVLQPEAHALAVSWGTATVRASGDVHLTPAVHAVAVTWGAATVAVSDHVTLAPAALVLAISWGTPSVEVSGHRPLRPAPLAILVAWQTSTVRATRHIVLTPAAHAIAITWGVSHAGEPLTTIVATLAAIADGTGALAATADGAYALAATAEGTQHMTAEVDGS